MLIHCHWHYPSCACKLPLRTSAMANRPTRCPACGTVFVVQGPGAESLGPSRAQPLTQPVARSEPPTLLPMSSSAPTEPIAPSSPGPAPEIHGETLALGPLQTMPGEVDLEAPTAVRSVAPASADFQVNGAVWPTGLSAQEETSFLLPPQEPDRRSGRLGALSNARRSRRRRRHGHRLSRPRPPTETLSRHAQDR